MMASNPAVIPERVREQAEEELKFYNYKQKAPEESVDMCHKVFNEISQDAMIEFSDEVIRIYH